MAKYLTYRARDLKDYMVRFFTHLNVPQKDAEVSAEILLSADLRGVDSHGIIRLNSYYGDRLRKGLIDPSTPISIVTETGTTALVDGGNGLGMVVGNYAMKRCIAKAKEIGVAMVTARNSNHYGIAGHYAMMALEENMIGISYTNAQPLVAPTYGSKAMLGTNPIAVAVPAGKNRPYVLDMATSIIPIGRVTVYEKANKKMPEGWAINRNGEVTTNPGEVKPTDKSVGGALLPLGGLDIMRGYKGYGLAMLVDIFSGVLSGSAYGSNVGAPGQAGTSSNVGHFFAAIRIDSFRPVDEFRQDMDNLIEMMKNSPKAVGQDRIYIAGEKEFEKAERYEKDGVPLLQAVVEGLTKSGEEVGVKFDLLPVGEIEE